MTNISYTKSWTGGDDGTDLTGDDIGTIKTDVSSVLNGNIDNGNISASAGIDEFKLFFDISAGHNHDGVNSRLLPSSDILMPHARTGLACKRASASTVTIEPGGVNIGGTFGVTTADLTLDMTSDFVSGSEASDSWFYIYVALSESTLTGHLSTSPPSLSDASSNAVEVPFRYDDYSGTIYRCIGAGFNNSSGDIVDTTVHSFDLSNCIQGSVPFGQTASNDFTVETIWTPIAMHTISKQTDSAPTNGSGYEWIFSDENLFAAESLSVGHLDNNNPHEWVALTNVGAINAITTQTTSVPGSFVIDQAGNAFTTGGDFHWIAWTNLV